MCVLQSYTSENQYHVKIGTPEQILANKHYEVIYVNPTGAFEYISWLFRLPIMSMKLNMLDVVQLEYIEKKK